MKSSSKCIHSTRMDSGIYTCRCLREGFSRPTYCTRPETCLQYSEELTVAKTKIVKTDIKVTDVLSITYRDIYGNPVLGFGISYIVNKVRGTMTIDHRDLINAEKPYDLIKTRLICHTKILLEEHSKAVGLLKILKKHPIEIEVTCDSKYKVK